MKKQIHLILLFFAFNASAVHINPQGLGEVLLVPYYTVNNDLNTLVTVTNTKDTAKAFKINVREGLNGYAVLSYNVYLDAFDTWTFALVSTTSTITGYEGKNSAYQISNDTSCAPFLNKQRQEFLPYELLDGPDDLSRTREGFIEIIEMGELTGDAAIFVDQGNLSIPDNCAGIEAAWATNGTWDESSGGTPNENLNPVTGGLMAEANLINVAEGINFSIPAVALAGFFAEGYIAHTNPSDTSLSLDAAEPKATVITNDKTYQLAIDSGIDAVSAVLMAETLIGTYTLDSVMAGKSEAVFIQPTRRFYVGDQGNNAQAPYNLTNSGQIWCPASDNTAGLSQYGGTAVIARIFNRESYSYRVNDASTITPLPPRFTPAICDSVSVWQFVLDPNDFSTPSISGSNNYRTVNAVPFENGNFNLRVLDTNPLLATDINTNQKVQLIGIPVMGITLQQVTNAVAGAGLLAQYGVSHRIKTNMRVIEQN